MPGGGSKPGERRGGRQKGTPNKRTLAEREAIKASGLMPLDFMLDMLRNENQPIERRMWAADKAAPFLHRRLSDSRVTIDDKRAEIDWPTAELVEILNNARNGRSSDPAPEGMPEQPGPVH